MCLSEGETNCKAESACCSGLKCRGMATGCNMPMMSHKQELNYSACHTSIRVFKLMMQLPEWPKHVLVHVSLRCSRHRQSMHVVLVAARLFCFAGSVLGCCQTVLCAPHQPWPGKCACPSAPPAERKGMFKLIHPTRRHVLWQVPMLSGIFSIHLYLFG